MIGSISKFTSSIISQLEDKLTAADPEGAEAVCVYESIYRLQTLVSRGSPCGSKVLFLIFQSFPELFEVQSRGYSCILRGFSLQCNIRLTLCPLSVSSLCKVCHSEGQGKTCWVMDCTAWVTTNVSPSLSGLCSFTASEQDDLSPLIVVSQIIVVYHDSNPGNECRPWKSTDGQSKHETFSKLLARAFDLGLSP